MKVLVIDNYDSFTYNLVHYVEGLDAHVDIYFNDQIPFNQILEYDKIILSPGPGLPKNAGQLPQFIREFHNKIPILGVCLGFQALVEFYGGSIFNQNDVKHGVKMQCNFDQTSTLFKNTATAFDVGLYHSWAANELSFPTELKITSKSKENIIMAFEHNTLDVFGVQFHPESILSEYGHKIIENFLYN